MRKKLFLSVFLPYLLLLLSFSVLIACGRDSYAMFFTKITVNNAFSILKSDTESTVQNYEDYEKRIKKQISEYRFGTFFYGWLVKTDGTELAVSDYKRQIDDFSLEDNRTLFLNYIKSNQPASSMQVKTDRYVKFIEYSAVPNTDLVIAVVADIPKDVIFSYNTTIWFIISVTILLLSGILFALYSANSITLPLRNLVTYGALLFNGSETPRPVLKDRHLEGLAFFMEGLSKKTTVYVDEDRDPVTHMHATFGLETRLFEEIDNKKPFAVCEVSINYFQPYLNRYGRKKTNALLRFTAAIVQSAVEEWGNETDISAHVDKNRFVIVTTPKKAADICTEIIKNFDKHINHFYDDNDVEKGFVLSKNQAGDIGSYPLAKVLIGVSTNVNIPLIHPLQIAHITSEIINYLGIRSESAYLIDRRVIDRTPYSSKPKPPKKEEQETEKGGKKGKKKYSKVMKDSSEKVKKSE